MNKENENQENLEQLLKEFFTPEQAGQVAEDIRAGQEIFNNHPAPKPQAVVVKNIKEAIAGKLSHKKNAIFGHAFYYKVAVAAVLIFAATISLLFIKPEDSVHNGIALIPAAVWDGDEISADDKDLATLVAEVQQIEDEFASLRTDEYDDSYFEVEDLQSELIEIDSDFWKG